MKTTVTPEIKISVLELHNSCPVATKIKKLEDQQRLDNKNYGHLVDDFNRVCGEKNELKTAYRDTQASYNALSVNYDALSAKHADLEADFIDLKKAHSDLSSNCVPMYVHQLLGTAYRKLETAHSDLKNLCEAYQKDAIMHHERRVRAIDLLKVVRSSAESQVDVINDFL